MLGNSIAKRINTSIEKNATVWKCINKEILEDASNELKLSATKISSKIITHHDNAIEDLINSFSNHYNILETKILDTIKEVIQLYAYQGKVIIIGRGGVYVSNDIPHSLHIKLQAPLLWRVARIQSKFNLTYEQALTQCEQIDKKRNAWNSEIRKASGNDIVYDLILNTSSLSNKQMLDIIFTALKGKKVIPNI